MPAPPSSIRVPLHVPSAVAATLGLGLLIETLRLWFPAVAFIFGRAGSTDPIVLGLFALASFLLAYASPLLIRWRGARSVMLVAGGVFVIARVVTQAAAAGDLQLWSTTVGALAGFAFLAAAAGGGLARAALAVGFAGGLALDLALELLTAGSSLDRVGAIGWVLLVPFLALFAVTLRASEPAEMVLRTRAWPWVLTGPVVALHLVLGGTAPALVAATTGAVVGGTGAQVTAGLVALLVTGAYALGVRYAMETRPIRRRAWPLPLVVLAAGVGAVVLRGEAVVLLPTLVLAVTLGPSAALATTAAGSSRPARHALAAVTGLLLLFLVAFPYYASYDLPIGVDNDLFLLAAVVVLGLGLFLAGRHGSTVAHPPRPGAARTLGAIGATAVVLGLVTAVLTAIPGPTAAPDAGFPLRVGLANVHMGFSADGRYVGPEQGAALAAGELDVLVVNEVDRGWALNGGQDVATDLARGLGLPYVFAPAADTIWGNAILSRLPVLESGFAFLPDSGGYMRRSAVWVVLDVGGGREVAVVGTHLHHRGQDAAIREPQARRVAEIATELAQGGRPVIVAGDLNARPGSPELGPLEGPFRHAAGSSVPKTYPDPGPERAIDHVFLSPDLRATSYNVLTTGLSDHAWILTTVVPAS